MFAIANILGATATILGTIISIYTWIIIISALLSWVKPDPYNPIVRTLRALTEPVQWRIRKWLPFVYINGLDLSPVVLILFLQFCNYAIVSSLAELAIRLHSAG
ncbi:MAG: YggT family protein [Deltaproteobacteria bacterium]|jgi:YggT family protein|nr:YggT family protein [Deltaproteobacteria bacterium]